MTTPTPPTIHIGDDDRPLSKAERALLMDDEVFAIDDAVRAGTRAARSLLKRGLIHSQLSPTGIAARAELCREAASKARTDGGES